MGEGRLHCLDFFSNEPSSITDVSIAIEEELSKITATHVRVIMDSLTTLGLTCGVDKIPPWILHCRPRLKQRAILCLYILSVGICPPSLDLAVQNVCEGMLEMRLEEQPDSQLRRMFRTYSIGGVSHSTEWYEFKISASGVEFLPKQGTRDVSLDLR